MRISQKEFEELVRNGIRAIPEKFLRRLENVDIVIEEKPTVFQQKKLKSRKDVLLLGLYEGIPQINRGFYGQVLPDKITIFKKATEELANSREDIKRIVRDTVWHEIAHHFGLNEREVRRAEKIRKTKS